MNFRSKKNWIFEKLNYQETKKQKFSKKNIEKYWKKRFEKIIKKFLKKFILHFFLMNYLNNFVNLNNVKWKQKVPENEIIKIMQ